jgi:ribonuclease R
MSKNKPRNHTIEGRMSLNYKGSGLLKIKDSDKIIEIDNKDLNTALNNDIVLVKKTNPKKGLVLKIIKRAKKGFSGTLIKQGNTYILNASDPKMYTNILIPDSKLTKMAINKKVFVEIEKWSKDNLPIGKIIKIIGKPKENDTEMQAIALEKGFDSDFKIETKKESELIAKKGIQKEDTVGRKDLRNTLTFTIDPEDAKDFDDAISIKKLENSNYEIGVHIADVSNYVKPGSYLDKEARERGTSVYLVDRTIPMLPEELSNDLCSLKPNVDRLTFSAIFEIDNEGNVKKQWFGKTIIHSNKRFTYEEAENIIKNKKGEFFDELNVLSKISKKLTKERIKKGAISLDQDEVKFKLDEKGKPITAYIKNRLETHKLVEEFMLLANKKVAEFMSIDSKNKKRDNLFLYRIHDTPNVEKSKDLLNFLKKMGYTINLNNNTLKGDDINRLMEKIEKHPLRDTINTAIIRTMAKAIYSTKNIGHYGLSFLYYTHFTSPIRRYPDIIVHRLLNLFLQNKPISKNELSKYEKISIDCSEREKEASDAERASIKYKQVEYMQDKIGKKFEGIITNITDWGIFVEEKETKCEGVIKVNTIKNDFYVFDKNNFTLKGVRKNKKFSLGDKIEFIIKETDLDKRTIDYILV